MASSLIQKKEKSFVRKMYIQLMSISIDMKYRIYKCIDQLYLKLYKS